MNPLYDFVVRELARIGHRVEDYPKDRHGRHVIPIIKEVHDA